MRDTTNKEGMRWDDWLMATRYARYDRYGLVWKVGNYCRRIRKAFLDGEDPTEHKAQT